MALFLTFPREKTTLQWSKVVSKALFPTNVGTGSARTESEEKATFTY